MRTTILFPRTPEGDHLLRMFINTLERSAIIYKVVETESDTTSLIVYDALSSMDPVR